MGLVGSLFQTRTGSTGHLALVAIGTALAFLNVSNPNGLHRSFSHRGRAHRVLRLCWFQTRTGSTGHLATAWMGSTGTTTIVSNPNGLHRPFSPDLRCHSIRVLDCFKPERAPQAI